MEEDCKKGHYPLGFSHEKVEKIWENILIVNPREWKKNLKLITQGLLSSTVKM